MPSRKAADAAGAGAWQYIFLARLRPRADVPWLEYEAADDRGFEIFFIGITPRSIEKRLPELGRGRVRGSLECAFLVPHWKAEEIKQHAIQNVSNVGAEQRKIQYPKLANGMDQNPFESGYIGSAFEGKRAILGSMVEVCSSDNYIDMLDVVESTIEAPVKAADDVAAERSLDALAFDNSSPQGTLEPSAARWLCDRMAAHEERYLHARPDVRDRMSRIYERGQRAENLKAEIGFECQICKKLGLRSVCFPRKTDGKGYVEIHHVMPVSHREIGSLHCTNLMVLCANHHRQLHYGRDVCVRICGPNFIVSIPSEEPGPRREIQIERFRSL